MKMCTQANEAILFFLHFIYIFFLFIHSFVCFFEYKIQIQTSLICVQCYLCSPSLHSLSSVSGGFMESLEEKKVIPSCAVITTIQVEFLEVNGDINGFNPLISKRYYK